MPLTSTEPHTAQDLTLFRHALDTLDDQLCILDESGNIVFVNESWIRFAIGNGAPANVCAASWYGESYLSACQSTDDSASNAVNGIRAVLQGRAERFSLEYPCHSPTVRRWFLLRIRPISGVERKLFLVAHLNITQRKLVEEHVEACLCATP